MKQDSTPAEDTKSRTEKAARTKAAILRSARRAFADHGYDGAGLRAIAQGAGVTAMMVNRYYGSKERLFAAAVVASMETPVILTPANLRSPTIARDMAAALVGVTERGNAPLDGFLMLFRSASSEKATRIAQEQIAAVHLASAQGVAGDGGHAAERAALLLSLVAGVQVMRQMIGLSALADADPEVLTSLLEPLFRKILEG